jgi:hypothetical protein
MRLLLGIVCGLALCADPIAAGKYTGTWQAAASGDFQMTLKQQGGKWNAQIAFQIAGEQVECAVTALAVEVSHLHAVYTFDLLDSKLESTIDGVRNGQKVSGKYRTRAVGDGSRVDEGTWEASLHS